MMSTTFRIPLTRVSLCANQLIGMSAIIMAPSLNLLAGMELG